MASPSKEIYATYVKVNPVLREYILATNGGSDIILPDFKGELWIIVKSKLKTIPSDYKPMPPGPVAGHVRIALPTSSSLRPVYNVNTGCVLVTNPLFRSYLDAEGQSEVEKFMMKGFKKTFRDFMTGAVTCNSELAIKLAIDRFCETYHLPMEDITYEMLRKDWYRYRNRSARGEVSCTIKEEL